jgi:hypothetical protein
MSIYNQNNRLTNLPYEIQDLIWEYARDDTAKKNFVNLFPVYFSLIKTNFLTKNAKIISAIRNNPGDFTLKLSSRSNNSKRTYNFKIFNGYGEALSYVQTNNRYEINDWIDFLSLMAEDENEDLNGLFDFLHSYDEDHENEGVQIFSKRLE